MKRTYVYNPETKQMEEYSTLRGERYHTVMGDIAPIVSPIDGTVITDRGRLRRYMKQHGIAFADEFKGVAEKARKERAAREARERKQAMIDSYEHVRNQERARKRYG